MKDICETGIRNKENVFLTFLSKLTYPFCYELPYICLFVILMAGHRFFIENLRNYSDTALLFLFAYIGAAIISSIKSSRGRIAVKTVFYIFPLIFKVISVFLFSNFYMQINATCITLLAETTDSESTEFINQYILSSAIIPTLQNLALNILAIIILISCIQIVPQAHAYVVEYLGSYRTTWKNGIHLKIPFFIRQLLFPQDTL